MGKVDVAQIVLWLLKDLDQSRFQREPRPGLRAPDDLALWEAQYWADLDRQIRAHRDTCA